MDKKRRMSIESTTDCDEIPGTPNVKKFKFHKLSEKLNKNSQINNEIIMKEDDDLFGGEDECFEDLLSGILLATENNMPTKSQPQQLNLSTWKRCICVSIERDLKTFDVKLVVREDKGQLEATCRLQGPWSSSKVSINDIISILAVWNEKLQCYCVSGEAGFVIIHPDHLVSGTSVVGALFCRRKGVLTERFTGIDSNNKIMTIGSLVHELFQIVISRKLKTIQEIQSVTNDMLNSREMMFTLYETQMTFEECQTELNKFTPNILQFIERYITGDNMKFEKDAFTGKIEAIQDIEENIWVPQLGLKGKVDVSVKIRKRNCFADADVHIMPLEIKTGKSSFSSEHRGQVTIYQMMMSEIGQPVDSGLLLYLREGIMKEIKITRNEQRDLILLRNEVAYYMAKTAQETEYNELFTLYKDKLKKTFKIPELPEPIHHHSACDNCPYNIICCTYLSRDKTVELSQRHPLRKVLDQVSCHLPPSHMDYFIHWTGLLALEEEQCRNENQLSSLWTETPLERQRRRKAITNLEICGEVIINENVFIHKFKPSSRNLAEGNTIPDLTFSGLNVNDYLRVSTNNRVAIAAGRVIEITKSTITLTLERNLKERYRNQLFILDKNDSQVAIRFNLANLGALLSDEIIANKLRHIIVEQMEPTFSKTLPKIIATKGAEVLAKLNKIQQKAVLRALTANDYLLLKGLPGTGKTQTVVALINLLSLMGKSVLITSHTHSAVDNVLIRLLEMNLKFLRLGASSRLSPQIHQFSEEVLAKNCHSPSDLERLYASYNIVGVTCLGASHPLLRQRQFDVCIVDESTQVLQATVIRPLLCARKFILVGDPDQLPPIVRSKEAKNLGADESLFKRLDSETATAVLTLQYRMNKAITKLANDITYKGSLQCATSSIATAVLQMEPKESANFPKWMQKVLSRHVDNSVVLLDTQNVFEKSINFMKAEKIDQTQVVTETNEEEVKLNRLYMNYCEVSLAVYIVNALISCGVRGTSIGIIAPYSAQVEFLKKAFTKLSSMNKTHGILDVEVNTVDQYQGRDKEVIIYSCTKCDNPKVASKTSIKDGEILEDYRRLTVAITRSKHKLILIGDVSSLEMYTPFRSLFSSLGGMNKLKLKDDQHGFAWNTLLKYLQNVMQTTEND